MAAPLRASEPVNNNETNLYFIGFITISMSDPSLRRRIQSKDRQHVALHKHIEYAHCESQ